MQKIIKTNNGLKGGLLKGKSHYDSNGNPLGGIKAVVTDQGGKPIEVEGNEVIINKKTVQSDKVLTVKGTPKEILSTLNQMDGNGVAIGDEEAEILAKYRNGGKIPTDINKLSLNEFEKYLEEKYNSKVELGDYKKYIYLSRIEVDKETRGLGIGSEIMSEIINYADYNDKKIALTPSTDYGASSVSRLKDFYKKFGFVENKGRNKDFEISQLMYRVPVDNKLKQGGELIKRADGSYSRRGLWDNIRDNIGSGRKPTKQMLEQEAKIKSKYHLGGDMSKHLAPNGKPSNLNHEQWHLVRTPEFKEWFGDWEKDPENASKVVDENGEPMICYHGTFREFNVFEWSKDGGFYFTEFSRIAEMYATSVQEGKLTKTPNENPIVLKCFLNFRNPLRERIYGIVGKNKRLINIAIKKGYDSLIISGGQDLGGYYDQYVAIHPNQIKLADGTNTTFDGNNPDIRFEGGGSISKMTPSELKEFYASPEGKKLDAQTYSEWKRLVNMTKSELEKFYNSVEGKKAGLTTSQAKEQGIDSGRESARWIMKMKDIPYKEWSSDMWSWAKKQIDFIKRMSGMKGRLYDDKGNKTRKHTALLIWGHNPEQKFAEGGGVGNEDPKTYEEIREYAENILKKFNPRYSAYSDTNGQSMYFNVGSYENPIKVRFSDHSVSNRDRMSNEVHFSLRNINSDYTKFNNKQKILEIRYRLGDKNVISAKREMLMPSNKFLQGFGYVEKFKGGGELSKKALAVETNDLTDFVRKYFISDGRIDVSDAMQELFGNKKGKSIADEYRKRIGLHKKGGLTISQLAHNLWEEHKDEVREGIDDSDFRNAVEEVLISEYGVSSMIKSLMEKSEGGEQDKENEFWMSQFDEGDDEYYEDLSDEEVADYFKDMEGFERELAKGTEHEMEHLDTLKKVAEGKLTPEQAVVQTAKTHIAENPEYYEDLQKMELEALKDKLKSQGYNVTIPSGGNRISVMGYGKGYFNAKKQKADSILSSLKRNGYNAVSKLDADGYYDFWVYADEPKQDLAKMEKENKENFEPSLPEWLKQEFEEVSDDGEFQSYYDLEDNQEAMYEKMVTDKKLFLKLLNSYKKDYENDIELEKSNDNDYKYLLSNYNDIINLLNKYSGNSYENKYLFNNEPKQAENEESIPDLIEGLKVLADSLEGAEKKEIEDVIEGLEILLESDSPEVIEKKSDKIKVIFPNTDSGYDKDAQKFILDFIKRYKGAKLAKHADENKNYELYVIYDNSYPSESEIYVTDSIEKAYNKSLDVDVRELNIVKAKKNNETIIYDYYNGDIFGNYMGEKYDEKGDLKKEVKEKVINNIKRHFNRDWEGNLVEGTVLWATKIGEPDWNEQIITENASQIEDAKKWALANGFDRLRVSRIDMSSKPDFTKGFKKYAEGGSVDNNSMFFEMSKADQDQEKRIMENQFGKNI